MVFIENVKRGMITAEDIYASDITAGGHKYLPLVRRDTTLTPSMISELQKRGIRFIYIKDYPIGNPPRQIYIPKPKPLLSPQLCEDALTSLEAVFSIDWEDIHESSIKIVQHVEAVVSQIVDSLLEHEHAVIGINDLKNYDDYTYHHSLSVAVLAVAIGHSVGINKVFLNKLGTCAIMHDIGKTAVPVELIQKPTRLTDEEFALVKTHSAAGYNFLLKADIYDDEMLRGVLHHHERLDGTGYPNHLKNNEIPLFSRVINIADVYDALTSNRPYRDPMQPAEAVEYIMGGAGTIFDYDLVDAFVRKVEVYSVGNYLELSDGSIAVVLNTEHRMRPVVRVLSTGEVLDLFRDRRCLTLVITRVLPDTASWHFR